MTAGAKRSTRGCQRSSTGTKEKHSLEEVSGPIARVEGGPFSGYSADLNGKQYFSIPYAKTGDLNICGPQAQVTVFAAARIVNLRQSRTIAGYIAIQQEIDPSALIQKAWHKKQTCYLPILQGQQLIFCAYQADTLLKKKSI